MWRSLIWKEWSEQRWKLALGCVILVGFCTICLRSRMIEDEAVLTLALCIGGFLMPVLVAMGLVARENADGSLNFLMALPASSHRILATKLAVGLVTCWVPLLVALVTALLLAGDRELTSLAITKLFLAGLWWATHLLIWILAFTIGQPNEARAGLHGLAVPAAWFGYLVLVADLAHLPMSSTPLWKLVYAPIPLSAILVFLNDSPEWGDTKVIWAVHYFVVQTVILIGFTVWAFHRFGKLGRAQS